MQAPFPASKPSPSPFSRQQPTFPEPAAQPQTEGPGKVPAQKFPKNPHFFFFFFSAWLGLPRGRLISPPRLQAGFAAAPSFQGRTRRCLQDSFQVNLARIIAPPFWLAHTPGTPPQNTQLSTHKLPPSAGQRFFCRPVSGPSSPAKHQTSHSGFTAPASNLATFRTMFAHINRSSPAPTQSAIKQLAEVEIASARAINLGHLPSEPNAMHALRLCARTRETAWLPLGADRLETDQITPSISAKRTMNAARLQHMKLWWSGARSSAGYHKNRLIFITRPTNRQRCSWFIKLLQHHRPRK